VKTVQKENIHNAFYY